MASFRQVSTIMMVPQTGAISLKTLALNHRWEGGSIGTGYSCITDRYSVAELIQMSGKTTYSEALEYFDLNPNGKTTNPFRISLRAILLRHKTNSENRFRFLTYNTYLLKVKKAGITFSEKPLIAERSPKIGQIVHDNFDVACLYEIFTDDVWEIVKKSWPATVQYNRGETDSDVICIIQKGKVVEKAFHAFESKGIVTDSDWLAAKGVLFTKIDTGFGLIEVFCTHLFFGGGFIGDGSSSTERTEVKIAETKELLAFYHGHHQDQNVALIVGDFNIDANANLNRLPYKNNPLFPYSVEEYNREYKALKALMAENNFYDLWLWDIYKRQPNTGYTTRYTDDDLDKDFATCKGITGDYCVDSQINEPKRHNLGEGRLDYVFIQKPEKAHAFNLDVTIPKRKAFKQLTKKGDEYENFLSDHLGLSFDLIVSGN